MVNIYFIHLYIRLPNRSMFNISRSFVMCHNRSKTCFKQFLLWINYRPRTKFSQASVSHFVHRGLGIPGPLSFLGGRYVLSQVPCGWGVGMCRGGTPYPPAGTYWRPPHYCQQAGGTHPTGMLSY